MQRNTGDNHLRWIYQGVASVAYWIELVSSVNFSKVYWDDLLIVQVNVLVLEGGETLQFPSRFESLPAFLQLCFLLSEVYNFKSPLTPQITRLIHELNKEGTLNLRLPLFQDFQYGGLCPLHIAILCRNAPFAMAILAKGGDPSVKTNDIMNKTEDEDDDQDIMMLRASSLHLAVEAALPPVVGRICSINPDLLLEREELFGDFPLHVASRAIEHSRSLNDVLRVITTLIRHSTSVSIFETNSAEQWSFLGQLIYSLAAKKRVLKEPAIVEFIESVFEVIIAKHGEPVLNTLINTPDKDSELVTHIAASRELIDVMYVLFKHGGYECLAKRCDNIEEGVVGSPIEVVQARNYALAQQFVHKCMENDSRFKFNLNRCIKELREGRKPAPVSAKKSLPVQTKPIANSSIRLSSRIATNRGYGLPQKMQAVPSQLLPSLPVRPNPQQQRKTLPSSQALRKKKKKKRAFDDGFLEDEFGLGITQESQTQSQWSQIWKR
ncbi:hypothetical protein PCE1_004415 [Barthelona sp. PCE]